MDSSNLQLALGFEEVKPATLLQEVDDFLKRTARGVGLSSVCTLYPFNFRLAVRFGVDGEA